jgi:hypothetical protein
MEALERDFMSCESTPCPCVTIGLTSSALSGRYPLGFAVLPNRVGEVEISAEDILSTGLEEVEVRLHQPAEQPQLFK